MPKTLADVAALVRSKNAGPFWVTFDIMMDNDEAYEALKRKKIITRELIARTYKLDAADVIVVEIDAARAIKISIPRLYSNGAPEDADLHGGQQYAPLLDLIVED